MSLNKNLNKNLKFKNFVAVCLLLSVLPGTLLLSACGKQDNPQDSQAIPEASEISEAIATQTVDLGNAVADSQGVWAYNDLLIYHASDNQRYYLEPSPDGTIQDRDHKTYTFRECDNRLYYIQTAGDSLTVKEGKFSEENVGKKESPDGFKPMVINYHKSEQFDLDALEQAITGQAPENSENLENTENSGETENSENSENPENPENPVYIEIYQDIEDFMKTDNFIQKDPGNRALELFNHLNNLGHANIEQSSITNDTATQEVRFRCYDRYTFAVNVADSEITVTEEES